MIPDLDQDLARLRDTLPRVWWSLYRGSVAAGFSEQQAFSLLQTYILAQNPWGIRPGEAPQRPGEEE